MKCHFAAAEEKVYSKSPEDSLKIVEVLRSVEQ